ncbi:MAG: ATPase, T2SS/T4P/T4SS family [Arhodomonas sp.]|nr:ATPase, T2SS/T4P/T4SS family [Arhodomonas sp.]
MAQALAYAETGHLCLSTLHANNANQTLQRILNFFPENAHRQLRMDLSQHLRAIVSQRLVPANDGARVPAVEILTNTPMYPICWSAARSTD